MYVYPRRIFVTAAANLNYYQGWHSAMPDISVVVCSSYPAYDDMVDAVHARSNKEDTTEFGL